MHFYIHVKLPFPEGGSEGQNLYYNDLETRLPLFSHYIGDLQRTAAFHTVDLQSTNTPVGVEVSASLIRISFFFMYILPQSLLAEQVFVKATNGHIKGLYNVTNRIELGTTNGAIKAVTNLESDGTSEATASLHSTNG